MTGPSRRSAQVRRATAETAVEVSIDLDAAGAPQVSTGLPFFDHMVSQLGKHSGTTLVVRAEGDLAVDAHHTVEDVGLAVGQALAQALGDKSGVRRFASVSVPLDEALVDVALDLSGRPYLAYEVDVGEEPAALGSPPFDPHLAEHFWQSVVTTGGLTLHVHLRRGRHLHHILEASFKAVARALRDAVRIETEGVPSTKGTL